MARTMVGATALITRPTPTKEMMNPARRSGSPGAFSNHVRVRRPARDSPASWARPLAAKIMPRGKGPEAEARRWAKAARGEDHAAGKGTEAEGPLVEQGDEVDERQDAGADEQVRPVLT